MFRQSLWGPLDCRAPSLGAAYLSTAGSLTQACRVTQHLDASSPPVLRLAKTTQTKSVQNLGSVFSCGASRPRSASDSWSRKSPRRHDEHTRLTGRPPQLIGRTPSYVRISVYDRFALLKGSNAFKTRVGSRKPRQHKIDHTFRTTLTIAHDDSINLFAPLLIVRVKCSGHIAIGSRKLHGKRFRIEDRLGGTVTAKGIPDGRHRPSASRDQSSTEASDCGRTWHIPRCSPREPPFRFNRDDARDPVARTSQAAVASRLNSSACSLTKSYMLIGFWPVSLNRSSVIRS